MKTADIPRKENKMSIINKATDKWFRLLKGIPLNEQRSCMPGTVYNPATFKCEDDPRYGQAGGAIGAPVPTQAAEPAEPQITCHSGTKYNPQTKKCEREMSSVRQQATEKVKIISKKPAKGKPAVKMAQTVTGDIIFGDAHLPAEKRQLDADGFIGPNTLRAFANVGIDSSVIGEDPESRKNWRMATRNIEVIRNALAEKYNAALPHIGVDNDKALAAAQAVKMTAKRVAKTMEEPVDITGEGKAEVPVAKWVGGVRKRNDRKDPTKTRRSPPRKLGTIDSIIIHDTLGGTTDNYKGMLRAFDRKYRKGKYPLGTHFSIGKSGKIFQHITLDQQVYHAPRNRHTIGIDLLHGQAGLDGGWTSPGSGAGEIGYKAPPEAQIKALYDLVQSLLQKVPSIKSKVFWPATDTKVEKCVSIKRKNKKGKEKKIKKCRDITADTGGGWMAAGKQFGTREPGISAHAHVESSRRDGLLQTYYLWLRMEKNFNHEDAFKKATQDEQQRQVEFLKSDDPWAKKYVQRWREKPPRGRRGRRIQKLLAKLDAPATTAVTEGIKVKMSKKKL